MNGILFDNVQVKLAPKSVKITGTWKHRTSKGLPLAYDTKLVKAVYTYLKGIENPIMLDVGASTGSFALLGVAIPTLWVTAFEPNPKVRRLLGMNIQLNGLEKRTKIMPYALFDRAGRVTLKIPAEPLRMGMATIGTPKRFTRGTKVKVEAKRIDDLDIGPAHFIKIDAEGADLLVLKGGARFIKAHRPVILVESHEPNTTQFNYKPAAIRRLLNSWGYTCRKRGKEDLWATPKSR